MRWKPIASHRQAKLFVHTKKKMKFLRWTDSISHSQAGCPVPSPDEILASWQVFIVRKFGFRSFNNVLIITV